jgi:Cu-processing system permease protein
MNALWAIAIITFKEGIRNRAFYGISLLALLLLGGNLLLSGMVMQEVDKVAVDMALSAVAFIGLLVVLFVGINLLAKDLDRKTIYTVLARPISRGGYILGKFAGMLLLLLTSMGLLSAFGILSILLVKWSFPDHFQRFSWPLVLLALAMITLSLVLLTAVSFLFASFSSSSFITLVLTTLTYLLGHSIGDVKSLVEAPEAVGINVSGTTVKVVQGAYYLFPNLTLFDIKLQAAHLLTVSASYVWWTTLYGITYTLLTITAAALIFGRREFP